MEVVNALGRRKRAIARVFVSEGTGTVSYTHLIYGTLIVYLYNKRVFLIGREAKV